MDHRYQLVSRDDAGSEHSEDVKDESPPFIVLKIHSAKAMCLAALALFALWTGTKYAASLIENAPDKPLERLRQHCANVSAIGRPEFLARQTALAQTLHALNASAYIAEPGASAQFFGNLSSSHWHLSERPLLLIVSPEVAHDGDAAPSITPKVSVLTPTFEATRAKLLPIPATDVAFAEWPEDADPYSVALSLLPETTGTIYVDGSIRNFIVDGLRKAGKDLTVLSAPVEIRHLRERKSPAELEIMKCANEATVLAIRVLRKRMYIGIRESQARALIKKYLSVAGLVDLDALVLFGENAALPHGSGTDRALGENDFALVDCGGALHGYHSDVTRTFALGRRSDIPPEHLAIWNLVHTAQATALQHAVNGTQTHVADDAARKVLTDAGYGAYFTHRAGHGIGLEVHESPYLRGGSSDVIAVGHTFSDEPGVYIDGKVGVRLEDCFYINDAGLPIFLTAGVGGPGSSPWSP